MSSAVEIAKTDQAQRFSLVDTDVHPSAPWNAVLKYMSESWRRHFELKGAPSAAGPYRFSHPAGTSLRGDLNRPVASDPAVVAEELLDQYGVDCALLNAAEPAIWGSAGATTEEGVEITRAYNDYFIENWLPVDGRFRLLIAISSMDPAAGVAEIERLRDVPEVVGVQLRSGTVPVGHRHHWPIYAAAEDAGLPIYVHAGGGELMIQGLPGTGSLGENYTDRYIGLSSVGSSIITSLILNGIFERFPNLRYTVAEYGFSWLLPHLWRMDTAWRALRIENPWVKRAPSEYVRDHIKLTTQPVDETPGDHLARMIDMLGDRLLMFSTDYPHWDQDTPDRTFRGVSDESMARIRSGNAVEFYRLEK